MNDLPPHPDNTNASSVAIIGSGIAGSAAAWRLATVPSTQPGRITVYEIGRGPGGRGATRKTRSIPELSINHGVPYADISTEQGRALLATMGDSIQPYAGTRGVVDGATGAFMPQGESDGVRLIRGANGEMANIAASLLQDGNGDHLPPVTTAYSTMVRGLARGTTPADPWILTDRQGDEVGRADWLIVAGNGVAHPRWSDTFGGEPPLVGAASALDDDQLNESLRVIGQQTAAPVITVLLYATGAVAREWKALAFNDALVKGHDVLAKISIQPCGADGCAVVLHSTTPFALENAGVHGASSSAARVGNAASSADREAIIVDEMLAALGTIPDMPTVEKSAYPFGPLLHRWGNAFPRGEPLAAAQAVCPGARVAFCGDYVETAARMGSYECALLSGINVADTLIPYLQAGR